MWSIRFKATFIYGRKINFFLLSAVWTAFSTGAKSLCFKLILESSHRIGPVLVAVFERLFVETLSWRLFSLFYYIIILSEVRIEDFSRGPLI